MTRVAIVILNWNGIQFLKLFLPGLKEHSMQEGVEIIVADNASEDESLEYLVKDHPDVRIITLDKNYGFAGGYNKALTQVEAEYYLIINSDIEVNAGYLQPLLDFMDKHLDVAACAPRLLDYKQKDKYEYAGALGGYIDKFGFTFCRGRIFNEVEKAGNTDLPATEVFWTTGACMMIRSSVFWKVNGFDADFFAHMEEIDLCWRIKNAGFKLACIPSSTVYHVGGGTLSRQNPFKTYLNFRNNLFILYKNLPESRLAGTMRKRMILDGIAAIMFMVSFKFKDLNAVYRAHKSFRKKKEDLIQYRMNSNNQRKEHEDIYQHSVVLDYFLLGRKTFDKLRFGYAKEMINRTFE